MGLPMKINNNQTISRMKFSFSPLESIIIRHSEKKTKTAMTKLIPNNKKAIDLEISFRLTFGYSTIDNTTIQIRNTKKYILLIEY